MNNTDIFKELLQAIYDLHSLVEEVKASTDNVEKEIKDITLRVDKLTVEGIEIKIGGTNSHDK